MHLGTNETKCPQRATRSLESKTIVSPRLYRHMKFATLLPELAQRETTIVVSCLIMYLQRFPSTCHWQSVIVTGQSWKFSTIAEFQPPFGRARLGLTKQNTIGPAKTLFTVHCAPPPSNVQSTHPLANA